MQEWKKLKECCRTVTLTDVSVGWTELRSVMNKAARWITEQLDDMREEIPYPILGLDGDNRSEFINRPVVVWTASNGIMFT